MAPKAFVFFVACLTFVALAQARNDNAKVRRSLRTFAKRGLVASTLRDFTNFVKKYGKVYKNSREWALRRLNFIKNMIMAKVLQKGEKGTAVYGASIFADMTPEEFRNTMGSNIQIDQALEKRSSGDNRYPDLVDTSKKLPKSWDWRKKRSVSSVQDQKKCGSCWTFTTAGLLEAQIAKKSGKLINLSEQNILDCDTGSNGCHGGSVPQALGFIKRRKHISKDSAYPYKAAKKTCKAVKPSDKVNVEIKRTIHVPGNETLMKYWLHQHGPLSLTVNSQALQLYLRGVADPWKMFCDPKKLNHVVLLVGYGKEKAWNKLFNETNYWIVKNSWGKMWGRSGYWYVKRNDNICGLDSSVWTVDLK